MEGSGWGVRVDVIEELKFLGKFTKTIGGGGRFGWGLFGGVGGGGGQGGSDGRIEVFVKIQKKNFFFFLGGGGGSDGRVGGQGGCERRIEVFVKIQKKIGGGDGWGGVGVGFGGPGWM